MRINIPAPVRVALYILTMLGAPVAVYLRASGVIGDLELALWSAEVSAVSALAAFNVPPSAPSEARRAGKGAGGDAPGPYED